MYDSTFSNTATQTSPGQLECMPVVELAIGMTVEQLDKPWIESSFLMQGFKIESETDIEALQSECNHVYIAKQAGSTTAAMILARPEPREFEWRNTGGGRIL